MAIPISILRRWIPARKQAHSREHTEFVDSLLQSPPLKSEAEVQAQPGTAGFIASALR